MAVTVSRDSRKSFASLFSRSRTRPRIDLEDVAEDEPLVESGGFHQKEIRFERSAFDDLGRPEKRAAAAFRAGQQILLDVLLLGDHARKLRDKILDVRGCAVEQLLDSKCLLRAKCSRAEQDDGESAMAMNRIGIVLLLSASR